MKKESNKNKAIGYDNLASNIFSKAYPIIAKQILEYTNINKGICIDIGSGGGYLGIEIAKISNMKVYLLDKEEDNKKIAEDRIYRENLSNRVFAITGDVHDLEFKDNFADLIVSRASYGFWEDKNKAMEEIFRVLKQNGKGYIGKGFGSRKLKREIEERMFEINPEKWYPNKKEITEDEFKRSFIPFIEKNNIEKYDFRNDETGNWIIFEK